MGVEARLSGPEPPKSEERGVREHLRSLRSGSRIEYGWVVMKTVLNLL